MADAVRMSGFFRQPIATPAAPGPHVERTKQHECEQGGGHDHDEELVSIVHECVLSRMLGWKSEFLSAVCTDENS